MQNGRDKYLSLIQNCLTLHHCTKIFSLYQIPRLDNVRIVLWIQICILCDIFYLPLSMWEYFMASVSVDDKIIYENSVSDL